MDQDFYCKIIILCLSFSPSLSFSLFTFYYALLALFTCVSVFSSSFPSCLSGSVYYLFFIGLSLSFSPLSLRGQAEGQGVALHTFIHKDPYCSSRRKGLDNISSTASSLECSACTFPSVFPLFGVLQLNVALLKLGRHVN